MVLISYLIGHEDLMILKWIPKAIVKIARFSLESSILTKNDITAMALSHIQVTISSALKHGVNSEILIPRARRQLSILASCRTAVLGICSS